jgi:hypothetical protein
MLLVLVFGESEERETEEMAGERERDRMEFEVLLVVCGMPLVCRRFSGFW